MKIERLAVENFKSFDRLDLELGDFNVFIGANASGKSNVLHILEFLRDIAASGLRNAVSMQGGVEYLRNVQVGTSTETCVEAHFATSVEASARPSFVLKGTRKYVLALGYKEVSSRNYKVVRDFAESRLRYTNEDGESFNDHEALSHENTQLKWRSLPSDEANRSDKSYFSELALSEERALLETRHLAGLDFSSGYDVGFIPIYDFDTRAQRKAAPITGKLDFEEDGSNVALALKNLLEDEEKRRRFTNLIQYVLPFVSNVDVERFAGRSLIPTLEETHAPGTPLPASLLSEGTIKAISLLIALYFEDKPVIAFEEPASNLHPQLISRVVEMMKEQSGGEEGKQVFVTTHSPEVIKHAGLENVYLVSRDENGFSTVSKPADKEEVAIFLANDMGLDDLFVEGLLEL